MLLWKSHSHTNMSPRGQDLHPLPGSLVCPASLLPFRSASSAHLYGGSDEASVLQVVPTEHSPVALPPKPFAGTMDFHCTEITVISWNSFNLKAYKATCICTQLDSGGAGVGPGLSPALNRLLASQPGFPLCRPEHNSHLPSETLKGEKSSLGPLFPPTIISSFPSL